MMSLQVGFTGGSGCVGQHIARLAPDAIQLRTRLESETSEMRREIEALSFKPEVLIHLAALTSTEDCEKDPQRAYRLNALGAVKWLEAAAAEGCRHFVFASTSHVFQPTASLEWLSPTRATDARSSYGRSKMEAEKILRERASQLGLALTIARIFSVIDPNMRRGFLYSELQRRAREGDLRPISGYKNVRDFIKAHDVAEWLLSLAHEFPSQNLRVLHICSGHPQSVQDLAIEVFRAFGKNDGRTLVQLFPETMDAPNYLVSKPGTEGLKEAVT